MAITLDSKLKEIMKNPEAVAIIDKYNPGFAENKQLKMCYGMTLRSLLRFPQSAAISEHADEIEEAFAKIAE